LFSSSLSPDSTYDESVLVVVYRTVAAVSPGLVISSKIFRRLAAELFFALCPFFWFSALEQEPPSYARAFFFFFGVI
jgi:hypothetical protein